jgi:hypothetical protein
MPGFLRQREHKTLDAGKTSIGLLINQEKRPLRDQLLASDRRSSLINANGQERTGLAPFQDSGLKYFAQLLRVLEPQRGRRRS